MLSATAILSNFEKLSAKRSDGLKVFVPETRARQYSTALTTLLGSQKFLQDPPGFAVDEPYIKLSELLGFEDRGNCELTPAVHLASIISDIRRVRKGDSVSYGATHVFSKNGRVGLVPIGFADGLDRKLSGHLKVTVMSKPIFGTSLAREVPSVGRIAMDSISIDLEGIHRARIGDHIEIFRADSNFTISDAASVLGITASEVALRLSERSEVLLCQ